MIGYREALTLAKKHWANINTYDEHGKCYIFYDSRNDEIGGNSPVVVIKDGGKCVSLVTAISDGLLDEEPVREGQQI